MLVVVIFDGQFVFDVVLLLSCEFVDQFGVVCNIVVFVYQMFVEEGYLILCECSGYFVNLKMFEGVFGFVVVRFVV